MYHILTTSQRGIILTGRAVLPTEMHEGIVALIHVKLTLTIIRIHHSTLRRNLSEQTLFMSLISRNGLIEFYNKNIVLGIS